MKNKRRHLLTWATSWIQLLRCGYVALWRSCAVMWAYNRGRLTRGLVNHHLRRGALSMLALIRAKYRVTFAPEFKLHPKVAYIFMSNHLSLFDFPLIMATLPGTIRPIAKKFLFDIPIFGKAIAAAELLLVDEQRPEVMHDLFASAREKLIGGVMLWICPEGARSPEAILLPFKPGGFRLARETGAYIIPVGITGTERVLPAFTWDLHLGQSLTMSVGNPIDTSPYATIEGQKQLMHVVREEIKKLCEK